jgi:hypothetical protein
MKPILFLIIFIFIRINSFSQNVKSNKFEDSVLQIIQKATNEKDLYNQYFALGKNFMGENPTKELDYLQKALFNAEQTRDRPYIINASLKIADQFFNLGNQTARLDKAMQIIDKVIPLAKESQLNKETTFLLTRKAFIYRTKAEYSAAIKYNEEATNYAEMSEDDSTKVVAELSYATSLLTKDESLSAFKKYMNALNIVETMQDDKLKMNVYKRIADFYTSVKQYEKAKDYHQKVIKLAIKNKNEQSEVGTYQSLIFLNAENKDFIAARQYLDLYKQKAKTSKDDFIKSSILFNEVNLLFSEDESKVAAYIRNNPKIADDLRQWGYASEANKAIGIMYSYEKRKDSAEYFFQKAKSEFKPNEALQTTMGWNQAYAGHLERFGNYNGAIGLVEENLKMAVKIGSLSSQKVFCEVLDSLYIKAGNKPQEVSNKLVLYKLKDSIEKQQKTNELLNVEIDAENKRVERQQKIADETLRKKHNLQYMGIMAGIFGLFVLLAALGRLRVKPWLIRSLGFLSFILLFEFIILLADNQIHRLTHGEPLPILLIKIVLIAMLLPLHHWLEHKAIHYLLRHQNKNVAFTNENKHL